MRSPIRQLVSVFLCLLLAGCREEVIHDLDELRANQVQLLLSSSGISATKVRSGTQWAIAVPSAEVGAALQAVEQSRVLRRELARSVEESKGLLESREERAAQAERQLAIGLEQTLERIPGVLEARVHLHLVTSQPFEVAARQASSSASVLLIATEVGDVDAAQVTNIVAGASGVMPSAVSVVTSKIPWPATDTTAAIRPSIGRNRSDVLGALGITAAILAFSLYAVRRRNRRKLFEELMPDAESDEDASETEESESVGAVF